MRICKVFFERGVVCIVRGLFPLFLDIMKHSSAFSREKEDDRNFGKPMQVMRKFGARWLEEEECFNKVEQVSKGAMEMGGTCLSEAQGKVLEELWVWDRDVLGELEKRIKQTKKELEMWRRRSISQEQVNREHLLRYKLECLQDHLNVYWKQRAHTVAIAPFVKDVLDSLEFARGSAHSTWGSVRAAMGHPEPFPVKHVAIGNEDCGKKFYRGNYLKFYNAIRQAYPDIKMISNCDGSSRPLDHPVDLYDFHVYTDSKTLFNMRSTFDRTSRSGPKAQAFVSEYAVWRSDAGRGSLLASLAEAALLPGLEKSSDIVQMASYAPLFVNDNDQTWNPDAIVFNSWKHYGTPSYWTQTLFHESSGAMIHPINISSRYSKLASCSAITWQDSENSFLRVKVVNFGSDPVSLTISTSGLHASVNSLGSTATVLTSGNVMDENSFSNPNKVAPVTSQLSNAAEQMQVTLAPHSFTTFDLALAQSKLVAEM